LVPSKLDVCILDLEDVAEYRVLTVCKPETETLLEGLLLRLAEDETRGDTETRSVTEVKPDTETLPETLLLRLAEDDTPALTELQAEPDILPEMLLLRLAEDEVRGDGVS